MRMPENKICPADFTSSCVVSFNFPAPPGHWLFYFLIVLLSSVLTLFIFMIPNFNNTLATTLISFALLPFCHVDFIRISTLDESNCSFFPLPTPGEPDTTGESTQWDRLFSTNSWLLALEGLPAKCQSGQFTAAVFTITRGPKTLSNSWLHPFLLQEKNNDKSDRNLLVFPILNM